MRFPLISGWTSLRPKHVQHCVWYCKLMYKCRLHPTYTTRLWSVTTHGKNTPPTRFLSHHIMLFTFCSTSTTDCVQSHTESHFHNMKSVLHSLFSVWSPLYRSASLLDYKIPTSKFDSFTKFMLTWLSQAWQSGTATVQGIYLYIYIWV